MARRNSIFSLGVETLGGEVEIVDVPATDPRPIEDRLLEAHVNVMNADAAVVQDGLRNCLDASAALEQLLDLVNVSLESHGGLDRTAATAVNIGLQHISKTLKMPEDSMSVSLESFDVTPQRSSQVALESIREKLAAIWKAIVEMLRRALAWITTTIQRLVNAKSRLDNRVGDIEQQLKAAGQWDAKGQRVTNQALVKRLSTSQNDPDDVMQLYADTMQFLLRLSSHAGDGAMKAMTQIEKVMRGPADRDGIISFQTGVMEAFGGYMERAFQGATHKETDVPEGTVVYRSPILLGNVAIAATVPKRFETASKFELVKETFTSPDWEYLPVLDQAQVKLVLDSMRRMSEYEKRVKPFRAVIADLSNKIESLSKSFGGEEQGDELQIAQARSVREASGALLRVATNVPLICSGLMVSTCANMLALADASVPKKK